MEDIKSKKILVTGSAGFLGKYLIDRLRGESIEFIEFDYRLNLNLLNLEVVMDLPPVDMVVHLAANTNSQEAFRKPYELYHDNILGTLNIMEYCRVKDVKKIVYSSSYVYGMPHYLPIDEKHPLEIKNPYGRSKLMSERIISAFSEDYNIDAFILRNFNIYGAGQNGQFIIPSIINQLFSESESIILKDLSPKRDFVYVKDVIEAIWSCCRIKRLRGVNIFNLGIGKSYSVGEVLEMIFAITGRRKSVATLGIQRKNEVPDTIANSSNARKELDWQPRFYLYEGLTDMLKTEGRL
jgi:UDP-glucose 4-epimerase